MDKRSDTSKCLVESARFGCGMLWLIVQIFFCVRRAVACQTLRAFYRMWGGPEFLFLQVAIFRQACRRNEGVV